jgi:hypothetical protein
MSRKVRVMLVCIFLIFSQFQDHYPISDIHVPASKLCAVAHALFFMKGNWKLPKWATPNGTIFIPNFTEMYQLPDLYMRTGEQNIKQSLSDGQTDIYRLETRFRHRNMIPLGTEDLQRRTYRTGAWSSPGKLRRFSRRTRKPLTQRLARQARPPVRAKRKWRWLATVINTPLYTNLHTYVLHWNLGWLDGSLAGFSPAWPLYNITVVPRPQQTDPKYDGVEVQKSETLAQLWPENNLGAIVW